VRGYKHFANKLWNVTRFVLESEGSPDGTLTVDDKALVAEAMAVAEVVSKHIDKFRLDLAADFAYHYVWDRFAAKIIEESKAVVKGDDAAAKQSKQRMLFEVLVISLKLLHPFMPFVTEAIWQELPHKESDQLMVAKWPTI
jgi:valyl-tRNA synthetase